MKNVLFVCSQNKLRSPTAEQIFSDRADMQVSSAGTNNDAENPLDAEQIEWADIIFVMEKSHRTKVKQRFGSLLKSKHLIVLDIPDDYGFMAPELIALLQTKISRMFPA